MKALVVDRIHPDGLNILEEHAKVDIEVGISSEKLAEIVGDYDILIGRATPDTPRIEQPILERAGNLKVIGIASVGLDQCDQEYIQSKGVQLFNLPSINTTSVAEHAFALLLTGMRRILLAHEQMKKGIWNKHGFTSALELSGKTIGVIGFGNIGSTVGKMAKNGFGMNVLAYDPYLDDARAAELGAKRVPLEDLLSSSDVVTIHAPLTKETYRMIGEAELSKMKQGAVLLNLGRGGIVDEQALYESLQDHLTFAALDVQEEEPCYDSPLFELDNFIATPHVGGLTEDALSRAGKEVALRALKEVGALKV